MWARSSGLGQNPGQEISIINQLALNSHIPMEQWPLSFPSVKDLFVIEKGCVGGLVLSVKSQLLRNFSSKL